MTQTTTAPAAAAQPASEVTGIPTLIARLHGIAGAHGRLGGDEGFLGSLNDMEVGDSDQQLVRDAQEASRTAGLLWADAATSVEANNNPLRQAYAVSPEAGNKHANTNE
ncbi:MAG TPA: hypothetical protein VI172_12365 [Candidatus Dormibacteraeota bacterium]|jgi:hypothetical protein